MKKGFTLAEILIVLVIIGVLTMILLPMAFQSSPDEEVMKFKKGYNTFLTVIKELVSSDEYYQDGDLGIKSNGDIVDSSTYFCETFADVVSTKNVNCSEDKSASTNDDQFVQYGITQTTGEDMGSIEDAKKTLDESCKKRAQTIGAEITTTDDIIYYQTAPNIHFGVNWKTSLEQSSQGGDDGADEILEIGSKESLEEGRHFAQHKNEYGFYRVYKTFCMDIDGINKGEDPFGLGLRLDGKILTGKRADEWLNKEIQKDK